MGAVSDVRVDIAGLLDPILPGRVYPNPPDVLVAPAIWVRRVGLVADGRGLRYLRLDLEVVVVVDTTSHAAWDQLDDMTEEAWRILTKNGHTPTRSREEPQPTGLDSPLYADVIAVTCLTDCT